MNQDQQRLMNIVQSLIAEEELPSLRGVLGKWDDDVLRLSFVFDKPLAESQQEDAAVIATEILAQYSEGLIKDKYIELGAKHALPKSPYWLFHHRDHRDSMRT